MVAENIFKRGCKETSTHSNGHASMERTYLFRTIPQLYAGLHTYETTGAKFEIAMTYDEFQSFLNE